MSLTSKQIDELRAYAKDRKGELAKLINDAADTIEMLSAKLSAANMERSSQYYHGGWIPCSERLPEEKDAGYILKRLGTCKRSEYVLATVEVKGERMTVTACTYDGEWNWDKKYALPDHKVIAWMPLPEPWKGDTRE